MTVPYFGIRLPFLAIFSPLIEIEQARKREQQKKVEERKDFLLRHTITKHVETLQEGSPWTPPIQTKCVMDSEGGKKQIRSERGTPT